MIVKAAPLQDTLGVLMRAVEDQTPGVLCSVLLLDADGAHLRHGAAPSLPPEYVRAIDGFAVGAAAGSCGAAMVRREGAVVEDIASDPLWADHRELALRHGLRACWSTPLFDARGRLLGAFAFYRREAGRPTPGHQRVIEFATQTAVIAITRQREEAALRKARRRLETALEGSQVSIWEADPHTGEVWLDAGWAAYLGQDPAEARTTTAALLELVHPEDRDSIAEAVGRAMRGYGGGYAVEHRVRTARGDWKWILSRGRVSTRDAEGKALRVSGTNVDITARKQLEQALVTLNAELESKIAARTADLTEALRAATAAERTRFDFMANVTHELRTPLNSIIGFAELLKDEVTGPLNAKQAAFVADILAGGRQLAALVEGILEMSRLDAAGRALEREPVDIGAALQERVTAHREAARSRRVSIALEVAVDGCSAALDRKALRRMLDALIENAVKFSDEGGRVAVRVRSVQDMIEIAVADTGIGIAPEDLGRLFKPLTQLDAGRARRHAGVGLGLALARRLAELHGGSIEVASEPGKGSTFTLRLPRQEKT